ncbi:MAG: DUF2752 domain-containing protein [Lachnotalea sp.]
MKNDNYKILYKIGWWIFALTVLIVFLINWSKINYQLFLFPCLFHKLSGLYCPGCGGTRAVLSLIHGHPIASIQYNPIVMYGLLIYAWYMISNTIELLSKKKLKIGMKYSDSYFWVGLGIIIVFFLIRNILLVALGIDLTLINT